MLSPGIYLPTVWGDFTVHAIGEPRAAHVLLRFGTPPADAPMLVRIHSRCCFGDVFGGLTCDCRAQLEEAIRLITAAGSGLIFYLNQEGRGVGLAAKIEALHVEQSENVDTVEAFTRLRFPLDPRGYRLVSRCLKEMGISAVRLLTNNPAKCAALRQDGIDVVREPLIVQAAPLAAPYIQTKVEKMGHVWTPRGRAFAGVSRRS